MERTLPTLKDIERAIRNVPDFPKPGIQFKDITPVLGDPALLASCLDHLLAGLEPGSVDAVAAIDARGFIFGGAAAVRLAAGFVPVRKRGKLPYRTLEQTYELEYGTNTIGVHEDALSAGRRVLLIDDLLATGGTAQAALALLRRLGAEVVGVRFLIELSFLNGRRKLSDTEVKSLIVY